ncbi:ras association domain-containing protein 8 isoform X2 [Ictalurus furcatus]|uniref:ras association domain-containing protein 8 isoform X2 n=1 Tax=Ictalurus furcatus TaxID=66913 RepID=UPI002350F655|nr:ras association domain-containing protein 8 isoform X2 [Ictalurus furcatus]
MELKVWVDGVVRVVCGLSEETSCQDVVIALAQAIGQTGRYVLIQRLRDTERQLLATERPLESLAKLGQHSNEVQFYLRRTGPSNSSDGQEHTPSLHKPSETEPPKRNAPRKSLTFSLGPSSSPRTRPKQNRRTPSTKLLPESRASPLLHTSHLPSLSREEVFRQVLQQQERLQALEAQLELLERETQAWDQQEELAAAEQTLLEDEEQWEEELRTEMQRERAMRRQLAELHAKLEECGTSLHDLTTKSTHLEQDIQRERLEAEAPPTRAQPEDSVGAIQTELQSQQKQGEELECELVQTEKALGKAETLLQAKQEQLDELNKELRQCNLQQFIQQTGVLPAYNSSRTDLHQQLDQQELAQLLQDTSIDSDSLQRPTAKQFLGHPRNLRHPLVSSLNPEVLTSRESSWR